MKSTRRQILILVSIGMAVLLVGIANSPRAVRSFLSGNKITKIDEDSKKMFIVHISGAVEKPGIYGLIDGALIKDLLRCAHVKDDADISSINVHAVLTDGQSVHIPVLAIKESVEGEKAEKIDINNAGNDQLQRLPGIGPVLSERIIQYRTQKPFQEPRDLIMVSGIGEVKYNALKNMIIVGAVHEQKK